MNHMLIHDHFHSKSETHGRMAFLRGKGVKWSLLCVHMQKTGRATFLTEDKSISRGESSVLDLRMEHVIEL